MEKVIKVRHVLSAAGEFIQERRDFFSVKFVVDQKRLEALQVNLNDVFAFGLAEILGVRFRIMRRCVVFNARQVIAAGICPLGFRLRRLYAVINRVIIKAKYFTM